MTLTFAEPAFRGPAIRPPSHPLRGSAWLVAGRAVVGIPTRIQLDDLSLLVHQWASTVDRRLVCIPSVEPEGSTAEPVSIVVGLGVAAALVGSGPGEALSAAGLEAAYREAAALPCALWRSVSQQVRDWAISDGPSDRPTALLLASCGPSATGCVVYGRPPGGIACAAVSYDRINLYPLDVGPEAHAKRCRSIGSDGVYFIVAG